ncbi:MAG TPA: gamma-glutamyltransferase, partial [Nocardioidaceae bacterium]|nr:gamma-glutamyltransferase [Nocardioidaceae bacterium]
RANREERIEAARREWATGYVADAVDRFVRTPTRHSSGTDHAGVILGDDLAGFAATVENAVTSEFRGHTVAKTGAWGQGPVLLQTLAILDGYDDADLDPSSEHGAHLVLESLKLAMADRDAYYGDTDVPLDTLLSADYAATRRALINDDASHEIRPGPIDGRMPYRAADGIALESDPGDVTMTGEPTISRNGETRGDTCHVDVVDRWGNIVAITPSGGWLHSSPTVPELGFCLGTRLQMTWLDDDAPSALRPGARPRTTLSPTLLLRDGAPVAALGTPGGDGQDQWQLLYLLRVLVEGSDPQDAIDAPAYRTTSMTESFWPRTWTPGGADVEDRLGDDVIASLRRRGHVLTCTGPWSQGRLSTVTRNPSTGLLTAAANARGRQGYAAGR